MIFIGENFTANFHTFLADKNIVRPGNKPAGHVGAFSAK
jgi:hypothetical protein